MQIKRDRLLGKVQDALRRSRCVGLVGPRQCGKSTLAREIAGTDAAAYFDLEDPTSEARLRDAKLALETLLAWRDEPGAHFWGTHGGAELDLCWLSGPRRLGVECKYTSSPSVTKSMRVSLDDLALDHLYVVCPIRGLFPLADRITAAGLPDMRAILTDES